jgi:hypothetical protein
MGGDDDDDDDETVFKEELIKFRLKNFYNVGLQQHVTGCQSIDRSISLVGCNLLHIFTFLQYGDDAQDACIVRCCCELVELCGHRLSSSGVVS